MACLCLLAAGCAREADDEEETAEETAEETEESVYVDIVSEITNSIQADAGVPMYESQKYNYTIILDGCIDSNSRYYVYNVIGDSVPELIVGTDMMTVYSYDCDNDSVFTIGTVTGSKIYVSDEYGFLVSYESNGIYELGQYTFDGEGLSETVLVSAADEEEYAGRTSDYLADAAEPESHIITDRSLFE